MMSNGFDAASDARFRATVEAEHRWTREQVGLLWQRTSKLRDEIEAIRERINGAILWAAIAAGGLIFNVVRAKLGF